MLLRHTLCFLQIGYLPSDDASLVNFIRRTDENINTFENHPRKHIIIYIPTYFKCLKYYFIVANPFTTLVILRRSTARWWLFAAAIMAIDYLYCDMLTV